MTIILLVLSDCLKDKIRFDSDHLFKCLIFKTGLITIEKKRMNDYDN
ncbi:hypothetical protein LEP1GSC124_0840 [Leptospira interrogans serovar Pyrogenes str. 200701872]|uniref:Uncharacterized protein n=1 Tax=Leptospira interrogans serovar Pyrogenes str. 200701872 TaxID=1193029 RepID=M6ZNU5_LEPIR|nr:hypothetical protein LEP1GSC124_0840 [Leptospira interrogans serovar Pyrogenes str. 200701872]